MTRTRRIKRSLFSSFYSSHPKKLSSLVKNCFFYHKKVENTRKSNKNLYICMQ